jgi:hypothetical protein
MPKKFSFLCTFQRIVELIGFALLRLFRLMIIRIFFPISGKVILVAHHCGYHGKILLKLLKKFNIPYEDTIKGFCDSLMASK